MIIDTLKTIADTTISIVDTTVVKAVTEINVVTEMNIWKDAALMQTVGVIGGLIILSIISLILTRDKKKKQ